MDMDDSDDEIMCLTPRSPESSSRERGQPEQANFLETPLSSISVNRSSQSTSDFSTDPQSETFDRVADAPASSDDYTDVGRRSHWKQKRPRRYFDKESPTLTLQTENQSEFSKKRKADSFADEQDSWDERLPEPRQRNFYNQPRISVPSSQPTRCVPATYEPHKQAKYAAPDVVSTRFPSPQRFNQPSSHGPVFLRNPLFVEERIPIQRSPIVVAHNRNHRRKCPSPSLLENLDADIASLLLETPGGIEESPELPPEDDIVIISPPPSPKTQTTSQLPDLGHSQTQKNSQTIIVDLLSDSEDEILCLTNDLSDAGAKDVSPTNSTTSRESVTEVMIVDTEPTLRIFYKDGISVPAPDGVNLDVSSSPQSKKRKKRRYFRRTPPAAQNTASTAPTQVISQLRCVVDTSELPNANSNAETQCLTLEPRADCVPVEQNDENNTCTILTSDITSHNSTPNVTDTATREKVITSLVRDSNPDLEDHESKERQTDACTSHDVHTSVDKPEIPAEANPHNLVVATEPACKLISVNAEVTPNENIGEEAPLTLAVVPGIIPAAGSVTQSGTPSKNICSNENASINSIPPNVDQVFKNVASVSETEASQLAIAATDAPTDECSSLKVAVEKGVILCVTPLNVDKTVNNLVTDVHTSNIPPDIDVVTSGNEDPTTSTAPGFPDLVQNNCNNSICKLTSGESQQDTTTVTTATGRLNEIDSEGQCGTNPPSSSTGITQVQSEGMAELPRSPGKRLEKSLPPLTNFSVGCAQVSYESSVPPGYVSPFHRIKEMFSKRKHTVKKMSTPPAPPSHGS